LATCIAALRDAFATIDREVQRVSHWSFQGRTACAVLLVDHISDGDGKHEH
jgi:hypothetical protein